MKLSDLKTGEKAIIVKVNGHGSFRKRLIEMGFIAGKRITTILNAPLKDPIEYEILGYRLSIRREEAKMIDIVSEEEAKNTLESENDVMQVYEDDGDDEALLNERMKKLAKEHNHIIRVALVGNPNCGKTSLFNLASGAHEHVGNYSGVTVDAKEGKFEYKGYTFILVDLPGTYSLSAYSPEELYVRNNLIDEVPDVVINVVDASNLERNLYLTTQLIDMNLRVVMALNIYDELQKKGDQIDLQQFSHLIGMPVCPTVCREGKGVNELFDTVIDVYNNTDNNRSRHIHVWHGKDMEESISRIKALINQNKDLYVKYSTRYLAIKYLECDKEIEALIEKLPNRDEIIAARLEEHKKLEELLHSNTESAIVDAKYGFIQGLLKETYTTNTTPKTKKTITDKIDAIVTNKWLAFPIFLLLLYVMFQATFAIGAYPQAWINDLMGILGDFINKYMVDGWVKDMVIDGVIGGVGSVLIFLPNILILYLFISLMEDSGYMARAAFIIDKLMHKIGLHGKSFIPMVMGFGCNVPAIMATRTIENRKSRFITMAVVPFMSCAGRLPIFVLLIGAFFPTHGGLWLLGIYLFGIIIGILTAAILGHFIKEDDLPFVMELPPYRIPTGKAIWRHTWEKGKQYLQKMATTILIASIVIWFLGYFPKNDELIECQNNYSLVSEQLASAETFSADSILTANIQVDQLQLEKAGLATQIDSLYKIQQENSIIGVMGKAVTPIMKPIGFDWKMTVAMLTGVAAKELVVSSMGVMYSQGTKITEGQELQEDSQLHAALVANISLPAAIAFMIFLLLYFPCIATFIAIKNESGKWSTAVWCCAYTMVVAWIFAFAAYHIAGLFF